MVLTTSAALRSKTASLRSALSNMRRYRLPPAATTSLILPSSGRPSEALGPFSPPGFNWASGMATRGGCRPLAAPRGAVDV